MSEACAYVSACVSLPLSLSLSLHTHTHTHTHTYDTHTNFLSFSWFRYNATCEGTGPGTSAWITKTCDSIDAFPHFFVVAAAPLGTFPNVLCLCVAIPCSSPAGYAGDAGACTCAVGYFQASLFVRWILMAWLVLNIDVSLFSTPLESPGIFTVWRCWC